MSAWGLARVLAELNERDGLRGAGYERRDDRYCGR